MAYFPMFVDLNNRKCLVAGGGSVAVHKVRVLREFGAVVTVVAKELRTEMQQLVDNDKQIQCIRRAFQVEDLEDAELVVAATDEWEVNHQIAGFCKKRRIPVNAMDQPEDCDFIFPSYVRERDLVGAFSSSGKSPVMTQYLKKIMAKELTPFLGEVADVLGGIREWVKTELEEKRRCEFYREVLEWCLETEQVPTEEEIQDWIERKKKS